ncbi:MAG: hypothetical protein NT062_13300 [Proteobacteria bacterium]|nr:hypothetical protein [Pseudomonadota bacterium]
MLVSSACITEPTAVIVDERDAEFSLEIAPTQEQRVLDVVNTAATSVLDDDVPLDRRAAENIVAHRDGADGIHGTADDDPFDDLAELDAIPYVGPVALASLLAFVTPAS